MMKFLSILVFLAPSYYALAQQNGAQPPPCAANCTEIAAQKMNCQLTDASCLCSDAFSALVTPCVQSTCTVREALTATKISADMCGLPNPDGGKVLEIIPPACGAIATVALTLRFAGKYLHQYPLRIEDWLALGAWMMLIAGFSIAIEMSEHGMGRNIWEIPQTNIYYIFKLYYIDEILYLTCLCFAKMAILFLYLSLFPLIWFRNAVYVFIALTIMYNITFVFAIAFQCIPVSGAWTSWDGTFEGHCIDLNLVWWVAAALNIAFDVGIMGLPFWPLRKLQMSLKRKIQVGFMFGIGFFVTIVSIIRLQSLIKFGSTSNPTYDDIPLAYWSTLEMGFGIVISCLPAIRLFVLHFFPRFDKDDSSAATESKPATGYNSTGSRGGHFTSSKKGPRAIDSSYIQDNTSAYELLEVNNDAKLAR